MNCCNMDPRGVRVEKGDPGDPGERGSRGKRGPRGKRGHRGTKGDPGDPGSLEEYAYIYKNTCQEIKCKDCDRAVIFDKNGVITRKIVHSEPSKFITVNSSGKYEIRFSVTTKQSSQFALAVNGTIIGQTRYGSGCNGQQNNGQAILNIKKGDLLVLVDTTCNCTTEIDPKLGGTLTVVSASIILIKLS